MLNKSEVMMLIKQAGLDAQFRENSKNHWSDGVKKISEVPTYYQEHLVDYQLTVFKYVSENLIDIRTPSFINARLNLDRKTNLVEFNSRVKNIDLVENIYVQEFNKDYMNLRIKYLGKLEKMINQLKKNNISLKLINDQWIIKTL